MALGQDSSISATEIGRKKRLAEQLLYGKSKPVQHWAEGASELANALVGGLAYRKAEKQESEGKAEGNALLARLLTGGGDESAISAPSTAPSSAGAPAAAPSALAEALMGKARVEGYDNPQQVPMSPGIQQGAPRVNQAFNAIAAAAPPSADMVTGGLKARGLPEHVAQGFAMNIQDESNFNPAVNEQNPLVPGSRGGFGLAQWTGPRRVALEKYAQAQGKDVADPNVQMDFLVQELGGPESEAAKKIMATQTPGDAAISVASDFLRPSPENLARRVSEYGGQRAPTNQVAQAGGIGSPIDMGRPRIKNPDGSFSTEKTIGIEADGKYFNIPTIVNGQQLSEQEAIAAFRAGRNQPVGVFDSQQEADAAARNRTAEIGRVRGDMAALPGAEPAQFQTPGGNRQEDIAALLSNDFIDPNVKKVLLERLMPQDEKPVEVNGRLVNPKTGQVIADFSESKPVTVGEGQTLVDPKTGQPVFQGAPKPPTEGQAKAGTFADRLVKSGSILDQLENVGTDKSDRLASTLPGGAGNMMVSPEFQRFDQAKRDFVNAILRRESGAVISTEEFANADKQYFPQPGDTKETIDQKRANRAASMEGIIREAGPQYKRPETQKPKSGPQPGLVEDGYRFKGGNPADPNSWEKVQ